VLEDLLRLRWCVQWTFPEAKLGAATTVKGSQALVTALLLPSPLYVASKLKLPAADIVTGAEAGTLFNGPTVKVEPAVPGATHPPFGNRV